MTHILVIMAEEGIGAIPWARKIAAIAGTSLEIVCPRRDNTKRIDIVRSASDETPPLIRSVLAALDEGAEGALAAYDCRGPSRFRAVLDAARELDARQLILHAQKGQTKDEARALRRRLILTAPYDVLLVDTGSRVDSPSRILVPQLGGGGRHAIEYAARYFAGPERPILALPDPKAASRSSRVFQRAKERCSQTGEVQISQAPSGVPIDEALSSSIQTGDLVLLDADEAKQVPRLISKLSALRADRQEIAFAVGLTRAEDAAGPGSFERSIERFRRYAPVLTRDERRDLHQMLEQGGRLSTDFVVMMSLSSGIASLGLIQSSPSVVIGAMLVAPLMTPLVAVGMALTQGNARLFRSALHAMSLGALGALLVSMIVGLLSPWGDLSAEVVARGSPNIFDLGVALLSGMAASFALARPGLAGTLVGVAIAVALLPPLAAVGIALVKIELLVALGATILFLTNLLAIIVGSAFVFRLFGVDAGSRAGIAPSWVRGTLVLIVAGLLLTGSVLVRNLNLQTQQGVNRPYSQPLPPQLRDAVRARVAQELGIEIVFMAQSDIEQGFGLQVVLSSISDIEPTLMADLREIIERAVGTDQPIRIVTLRAQDVREE